MDTIQLLCRLGMSVTLIGVVCAIAVSQETLPLSDETKLLDRDNFSAADNLAAVKNPLTPLSNLLNPFIVRELPILYDQLAATASIDEQRQRFLSKLLPDVKAINPAQTATLADFTNKLIKTLKDQIEIEVTNEQSVVRVDWLQPLSEFLARFLCQLQEDARYFDATEEFINLEGQVRSLLLSGRINNGEVVNNIASMVAYYRLRCDKTIWMAQQHLWGTDASKLTSEFLQSHARTTGAAAAAYYAGYFLEHQEERLIHSHDEQLIKASSQGREIPADLGPEYWYNQAMEMSPDSLFAKSAEGAIWRRNRTAKGLPIARGRALGAQLSLDDDKYRGKSIAVMLFHLPPNANAETAGQELNQFANQFRNGGLEVVGVLCHPPTVPEARLRSFPVLSAEFVSKAKLDFPCTIDSIEEEKSISVKCGYRLRLTCFLVNQEKNWDSAATPRKLNNLFNDLVGPKVAVDFPPFDESKPREETVEVKEIVDEAVMPDISGKWRCPLVILSANGDILKTNLNRTCIIRESDDQSADYVIENFSPPLEEGELASNRLKWIPSTKSFYSMGVRKLSQELSSRFMLKITDDKSAMNAVWMSEPYQPNAVNGNSSNWTLRASETWRRLEETVSEVRPANSNRDDPRGNGSISRAEDVVQKKIDTGDTAKLRNEIEVYERRAKDLASSIARLHLEEKEEPFEIDLLSKDLKSAVSNAYDKKSQLEKLRIQEKRRRVDRLQDQLRRRDLRRTEIVDQQVRELMNRTEAKWETETSSPVNETKLIKPEANSEMSETNKQRTGSKALQSDSTSPNVVTIERPATGWNSMNGEGPRVNENASANIDTKSPDQPFQAYGDLMTNMLKAQDELETAQAEYSRREKLVAMKSISEEVFEASKRRFDAANRQVRFLKDEYEVILRDLELQLAAAKTEYEESREAQSRLEQLKDKVSLNKLSEVKHHSRQAELAYQRLSLRYDRFKGLRDDAALLPSPEIPQAQRRVYCWGMMLEPVEKAELDGKLAQTKYRGGMRVSSVDPKGAAAKAKIMEGDLLVGLGNWEATNADNIAWILRHMETDILTGKAPPQLKFVVVRNKEPLFGNIELPDNFIRR